MKQLILILILLLSNAIGQELYNPNGHPGTINIGITYDTNALQYDYPYSELSVNMPLTTWLTFKMNFNPDYIGFYDTALQINMGADFHIPFYKLWDK